MTDDAHDIDKAAARPSQAVVTAADAASIRLPLVSVIIVNYNYGRFLRAAVASVLAQSYRDVECIVVDNASTDESEEVLAAIDVWAAARDAAGPAGLDDEVAGQVTIIRRPANDGQTPASLDGLAVARGAYVIFADADDLLLPHCVESHVYAHLSLRAHVGFTSGDMLQVAAGQIVVASGEDFGRVVRAGRGRKRNMLRPFREAPGNAARFAAAEQRLDGRIHLVAPLHTRWIWSPTTGNCYRRDALALFADNPALRHLRTGTDMYFGHAIGALCGSALIDEPVFAYRIHGGNIYTQRAQLDRTLAFRPGNSGDSNDKARLAIIDHLAAEPARFAPNVWLRLNLVALLVRLDHGDRDPTLPRWARHSRLAQRLVADDGPLRETLGRGLVLALKIWSGVPLRHW